MTRYVSWTSWASGMGAEPPELAAGPVDRFRLSSQIASASPEPD